MPSPYWVKFEGGYAACVEADSAEEAMRQGDELVEKRGALSALPLPYPAHPRISKVQGQCPSFCHDPHHCAGRTCCPKSYACSE